MVAVAEISGQREIIFPEFVALAIGAWVAEKQPWAANKRRIFFLMSISSVVGVEIVRHIPLPLLAQICIAFIFTGIILAIARTNLLPVISACILPIYMKTDTLIYPVSVSFLSLIIIYFQWFMEKSEIKTHNIYEKKEFNLKYEFEKWAKLLILLASISLLPIESGNIYFVAPPLIVVFAELADTDSPLRKKPLTLIFLLTLAATSGWAIRYLFNYYIHLPLAFCALIGSLVLFYVFEKVGTLLPPAGAILLLPMIITSTDIRYYPLEIAVGSIIFVGAALLMFNKKSKI